MRCRDAFGGVSGGEENEEEEGQLLFLLLLLCIKLEVNRKKHTERETYRDGDVSKTLKTEREILCGKEYVIIIKRN